MVPPLVTAIRCAPGRPVSTPRSRFHTTRGRSSANSSDGKRPASRSSVASYAERGRERNGALRLTVSYQPSTSMGPVAQAATVCWARMSSGFWALRSPRSGPPASARSRSPCGARHRGASGTAPLAHFPDLMSRSTDALQTGRGGRGASTWITRSTAPMSMPSSRLDVATTQRRTPDFSSSSTWARCSSRRTVVGFGENGSGARRRPGLRHHSGWNGRVGQFEPEPLGVDLIEAGGQALTEAPRVDEDDRRAVLHDAIDDRLFDVGHSDPVVSVDSGAERGTANQSSSPSGEDRSAQPSQPGHRPQAEEAG